MYKKINTHDLGYPYNLRKNITNIILILPLIILIIGSLFLVVPFTRKFGFWLLRENNPIEILTFILFFVGGIYGIKSTIKYFRILDVGSAIFLIVFSFFLLIIAMEEIAWGQWFFHFETPQQWKEMNAQGETTLHNLEGWNGNGVFLRIMFGIGGLIGIVLNNYKVFRSIAVPKLLIFWFLVIVFHSVIDLIEDIGVKGDDYLSVGIRRMSELIEMIIAGSSYLYLLLNFRKLSLKA